MEGANMAAAVKVITVKEHLEEVEEEGGKNAEE